MKMFNYTSDAADPKYAYGAMNLESYCMSLGQGKDAQPYLDEDGVECIDVVVDPRQGGHDAPDFVANENDWLIVSRRSLDLIESLQAMDHCQVFSARLTDAKGRVQVDDYAIINPIEKVECLDRSASDMDEDGEFVRAFGKVVLSVPAIPRDLHLFRVRGVIGYVLSEILVDRVRACGLTNFAADAIELA